MGFKAVDCCRITKTKELEERESGRERDCSLILLSLLGIIEIAKLVEETEMRLGVCQNSSRD